MKLKVNTYDYGTISDITMYQKEVVMKATVHIKYANKFYTSVKLFKIEAIHHSMRDFDNDINNYLKITKFLFEQANKFYGNLLFDRNAIDPIDARKLFTLDEEQPIIKNTKGLYYKLIPRKRNETK